MFSGIVYDTLRSLGLSDGEFLLTRKIKPLTSLGTKYLFGPIFTTKGAIVGKSSYKDFDEIRYKIYPELKEGQIILLETNDSYCAHSGDITSQIYKAAGAQGFITDGNIRDSQRIKELDFPCFCVDTNPIDALDYWAIVDFQTKITLPNIHEQRLTINPKSFVYADDDGIMIIPNKLISIFKKTILKYYLREEKIRYELKNSSPLEVYKRFGRW